MDHGASALNSSFLTFSSSTSMDFDFIDKPFSQGCNWLETSDRINCLEPEPFMASVLYNSSQHNSPFTRPGNFSVDLHPGIEEFVADSTRKRWLIDESCTVKDKLTTAIEYMKQYVEDADILIQIWVPTNKGGQNVLTTIDQPYSLNRNCKGLASYRKVSKSFHLTTEEDMKDSAGLPGRVFLGKLPEWTPDVRFFRSDECPRKYYAKLYNISGCLALPVFDHDSGICVAVIEIVTTTQKISYHLEVDIVCKALEAVDLKSSQDFFPHAMKASREFYQIAVPEISDILKSVCETFRLPLAVTWAISDRQEESENQFFSDKSDYYISTVDSACCIAENDLLGFLEACSEHYLFLNQGIVGKAFAKNKQWFAADLTSFSKTDYPLSHHARIFNLGAAVAIPLRNMYTGLVEYVAELFFPRDCKDVEEQNQMLDLLSIVMQQACRSFHVITGKKLDEVNEQTTVDLDVRIYEDGIQKFVSSPCKEQSQEESSWIPINMDLQEDKCVSVSWDCPKQEPEEEFKITTHWDNNELDLYQEQVFSEVDHQGSILQLGEDSSVGQYQSFSTGQRAGEKKQTKTEKTISLQMLRQYFAGSLKDAAKSIGVCPTTLKRICRQHGINRWPSRKIKKVNHSLKKLQLVVNSIHGAEGLIQIDSFYKTFPELNNSNVSRKGPFSSFKKSENSNKLSLQPENALLRFKANDSKSQSSSSSQNSGSSISYSTKTKQLNGSKNGYSLAVEDPVLALKRTCREADMRSSSPEERNCHKPLEANRNCPTLPLLTTSTGKNLRDGVIFRVKATFGEENARFSFLPNWRFKDLQQEIAKRFQIDEFTRVHLKYLDIENEPVLLTCDADLEECIDLLSSSQINTLKITLHLASNQPNQGSLLTSRGLV